jgi:hypothetical protein
VGERDPHGTMVGVCAGGRVTIGWRAREAENGLRQVVDMAIRRGRTAASSAHWPCIRSWRPARFGSSTAPSWQRTCFGSSAKAGGDSPSRPIRNWFAGPWGREPLASRPFADNGDAAAARTPLTSRVGYLGRMIDSTRHSDCEVRP